MILILGASSGLGFALAKNFTKLDKSILVSRRKIKSKIPNSKKIQLDIVNQNTNRLLKKIKKNSLSYIFFTLGQADWKNDNIFIEETKASQILDTNFFSVYKLIFKLINQNKLKQNCMICFCSSVATILPRHRQIMYCASKTALNSFAKSLRFYCSMNDLNFKIVNIFLGYMDSEMTKSIKTPLKKIKPDIISEYIFKNRNKLNGDITIPKYWILIKLIFNILPNILIHKIFKLFFLGKKYS